MSTRVRSCPPLPWGFHLPWGKSPKSSSLVSSLVSSRHDLPCPPSALPASLAPRSLAYSAPDTGASSLLLRHTRPSPAPGPLHGQTLCHSALPPGTHVTPLVTTLRCHLFSEASSSVYSVHSPLSLASHTPLPAFPCSIYYQHAPQLCMVFIARCPSSPLDRGPRRAGPGLCQAAGLQSPTRGPAFGGTQTSSRVTQDGLLPALEPQFPNLPSGALICPSPGSVSGPSGPLSVWKHSASWALANGKSPARAPSVHHSDPGREVTGLQMPLSQAVSSGPRHCHI